MELNRSLNQKTTIAAIDIGTNSVRYLLVQKKGESITALNEKCSITRLGKGFGAKKIITPKALTRTKQAVGRFTREAKRKKAGSITIFGTKALRDAANKEKACRILEKAAGVQIAVISGKKEAKLSFLGAASFLKQPAPKEIMVIDIGGGSTELTFRQKNKHITSYSLNLGAVTLTERFIKHDPLTNQEYQKLKTYIKQRLQHHIRLFNPKPYILGVGGTATTLACVALALSKYNAQKINNYRITRKKLKTIINLLKQLSLTERKKITGLDPKRADIILSGALVLAELMELFSVPSVTVSTSGLVWGMVLEELKK